MSKQQITSAKIRRPSGHFSHATMTEARGRLVFYLSDDDLWFPEHIETMTATFDATGADFVHAPPVWRLGDGSYYRWIVDLAKKPYRQLIYRHANRVPLSSGSHTLAAYRALPEGWRVTPPGEWTDAWMWRQFADQPGTKFACSDRPTVLHFPSSGRESWTVDERLTELADHTAMLGDPRRRLELLMQLFEADQERLAWFETHNWDLDDWLENRQELIGHMRESKRWRAGERVAQLRRRFSRL